MKTPYRLIMIIFFGAIVIAFGCRHADRASVSEEEEMILTYGFSDPDPVPILTRSSLWGRGARLYPYSFIDGFSRNPEERTWTVVRLENPYIQVTMLPQVGGKIWGAKEKSSGQDFIYTNHVLKFREIALRGPWTSGGIEFNFGIVGHTPSGAHPVDYIVRKEADGRVSCVVGNMDLPSRTHWRVTVSLAPDKAFLETRAFWYNPTPLHQSYYCWMNGAIPVGNDLQYVFPGKNHIAHSFAVPLRPWPIDDQGRDLSWYRNNDFGSYKSYFTVGEYEEFFGGYWHDRNFGFGHWAAYEDMPGQKIWIWGLSRQGMIWENLLTDSDGQYSEPQAGRYFNQNDHAVFPPGSGDSWQEIWFPYKDIGPMVKASPFGVLNVTRQADRLEIALCALQEIDDDLEVHAQEGEIYRERVRLSPMAVYRHVLDLDESARNHHLILRLSNKLVYSTDPEANDLNRPIRFQDYRDDTVQGRFLAAERLFQERSYIQALPKYLSLLQSEPLHTRALCRAAELYFRRGEYQTALSYAHTALEQTMYDPGANFIYGVIARRLGRTLDAKETLGWAARGLDFRSSAYTQLAEIFLAEDDPERAVVYANRALKFNSQNINAHQAMAVAYRHAGLRKQAAEIQGRLLEIDPLNHLARFEAYLWNPTSRLREAFQSMIRNELPYETYMELALYYYGLGQREDAALLLEMTADYPMAGYWLAWIFREKDKEKSRTFLRRAGSLSPLRVFPYRVEGIPILEWAISQEGENWIPKYYLGLLFWSKGRVQEAQQLFADCGQPAFAPFYPVRAYFHREQDPESAADDYRKAVEIDLEGWRNWYRLLEFYSSAGFHDQALSTAEDAVTRFPDEVRIRVEWVRALMHHGRFREAADILEETQALPSEGATNIHGLFRDCHIRLALEEMAQGEIQKGIAHLRRSQDYPESLGTGRPYDPDYRQQQYLLAICYDRLNDDAAASEQRRAIREYTQRNPDSGGIGTFFARRLFMQTGNREWARRLAGEEPPPEEVMAIVRRLESRR